MWQWMGNMFFRKQPINVITPMRYAELREWNIWHEIMSDEESKIECQTCKRVYDGRKNKNCPGCGK
jgi:hypothetical protein